MRLALSEDPITLDPAFITDVNAGALSAKLFDGLVRFDAAGAIRPCLAKSWRVEDGGKRYVFTLNEGVRFHNGKTLTAQDVRRSFERLLDPATASPRRWVLSRIQSIQTPDERNVILKLAEPFAPFLNMLAMPNASIVDASSPGRPVGTGPFLLERWERDKTLLLKRNPDYFDGPANIQGVEYRILPEGWAGYTEFNQGRLDILAVPQSHMDTLLSDPKVAPRLRHRTGLNTYYLGLNCQRPPLSNPQLRRALAMAIDREKIVRVLLKQRGIPAHGPVPPELDPGQKASQGRPYDPEGAKALLQEAGVRLPLRLTLYQASSQEALEIMEAVQDYLAKVGVRVQIVQREWSSFKEAVLRGEADMFFLSWWADYPDAENFLFPNFYSGNTGAGGNKTGFSDPVFDAWILQAASQTDDARRQALNRQCIARIVEASPWIFLWHRQDWAIVQPWVEDWELSAVYNADKLTRVRLLKDPA